MDRNSLAPFADAVSPGDSLLLVGSVSSGLADTLSDIDLLLIAESDDRSSGHLTTAATEEASYLLGSTHVQVQVRIPSPETLHLLAASSDRAWAFLQDPRRTMRPPFMSDEHRALMHDISSGYPLANESIVHSWRQTLHLDDFAAFSAIYHLFGYFSRTADAHVQLLQGDAASSRWMLHGALEELAAAALCSVGETNPRRKWLQKLLSYHAGALGGDLANDLESSLLHRPTDTPSSMTSLRQPSIVDSVLERVARSFPSLSPTLQRLPTFFHPPGD